MTPFKPWGTAPVSEHPACILPFEPNWSTPVQETLSWKTGTVMTQVGAEQRRALRREPRLGIQFESLLTASDVSLLQSILMGWAGRTFAVPLWYGKSTLVGGAAAGADAITVSDNPETLFMAGGWALLWLGTRTLEAVPVTSISGNTLTLGSTVVGTWAEGTVVLPLQAMQLQDTQSHTPSTSRVTRVAWIFEQVPGHAPTIEAWPADSWTEVMPASADPAEPRNHFLTLPHNWAGSPSIGVTTNADVFDPGMGLLSRRLSVDRPTPSWALDVLLDGRAATAALRKFLQVHSGSAVSFWAASAVGDLDLAADVSGTTLTIVDNGQAAMPTPLRAGVEIVAAVAEEATDWLTFSYTGAVQTTEVPSGYDRVEIQAWGAGGGGVAPTTPGTKPVGYPTDTVRYHAVHGGAGAVVRGIYPAVAGTTLSVYVGQGGDTTTADEMTPNKIGGHGGHGSAVAVAGTPLVVAAGGGGAGTFTEDNFAGGGVFDVATGLGGAVGGDAGAPGQYRTSPLLYYGQGGSPGPAGPAGLEGYGSGVGGESAPGTPGTYGWGLTADPAGAPTNGGAGGGGGGYGGGGAGGYHAGGNGGGGGASFGSAEVVSYPIGGTTPGTPGTAWHVYEGLSITPTITVLDGADGFVRLRFWRGGRTSYRYLTSSIGTTAVVLTSDPADVALADVMRANWASKCRLAVDAITIEHVTDTVATCRLPVVAVDTTSGASGAPAGDQGEYENAGGADTTVLSNFKFNSNPPVDEVPGRVTRDDDSWGGVDAGTFVSPGYGGVGTALDLRGGGYYISNRVSSLAATARNSLNGSLWVYVGSNSEYSSIDWFSVLTPTPKTYPNTVNEFLQVYSYLQGPYPGSPNMSLYVDVEFRTSSATTELFSSGEIIIEGMYDQWINIESNYTDGVLRVFINGTLVNSTPVSAWNITGWTLMYWQLISGYNASLGVGDMFVDEYLLTDEPKTGTL